MTRTGPLRILLVPAIRRIFAALALLAVGILMFSSTQQAQAGYFYTQVCGTNAGTQAITGSSLFQNITATTSFVLMPTTAGGNCVLSNSNYYVGANRIGSTVQPAAGSYRGLSIAAPANTSISELVGSISSCRANTTTRPLFKIVQTGGTLQTFALSGSEGGASSFTIQGSSTAGCSTATSPFYTDSNNQYAFRWGTSGTSWYSAPNFGAGPGASTTNMGANASSFRLYLYCDSTCGTSTTPHMVARNLRVRLEDNTTPGTPSFTAGPWSNAPANNPNGYPVRKSSGTITSLQATSTDTGGGVYSSATAANDTLISLKYECTPTTYSYSQTVSGLGQTYTGSYPRGLTNPCPLSSTVTVPVNSLSSSPWVEGLNRASMVTTDYYDSPSSGNQSATGYSPYFVIDDTAPTVSSPGSGAGCFAPGTQGSNGWYTEAPLACAATASDAVSGREVAGLQAGTGLRYTNTMSGGLYGETSYFNQMQLTSPTLYWPLNGALTESFSGTTLSASNLTSGSSNLGPFANTSVYTFSATSSASTYYAGGAYGSMTVSAWVRPTGGAPGAVINQYGTTGSQFALKTNTTTGAVTFSGNISGSTYSCVTANNVLPANVWSHLAATRNSSTGEVLIYVNGNSSTCTGTTPAGSTVSHSSGIPNLFVGSSGGSEYFLGQIANVSIHRQLLGLYDIRELYTSGCQDSGSAACAMAAPSGAGVSAANTATTIYNPLEGDASITATATDRAGNTATATSSMKIDTSDPVAQIDFCTGTGSGAGGTRVNDWYTSNVTCALLGNDITSKPDLLEWSTKINTDVFSSYSSPSTPLTFSRVNLLKNPRALVDTTAWTNVSMASMTRARPPAVLNGRTNTAVSFNSSNSGATLYTAGAVESGTSYVCSAYVYRASGGTAAYRLQAQSSTGATLATSTGSVGQTEAGSWVRLDAPFTATATENARCAIVQDGAGTSAVGYVSEVMLEANVSQAMPFFDGSSPGATWTGTPLNSESTLSAADKRTSLPVSTAANGNEGQITIKGRVTDTAGRTTVTSERVFKVDRNNPSTSINCGTPTGSNGWFTSQPTCTLSGQDTATGSGVSSLSRSINGGAYSVVASSP